MEWVIALIFTFYVLSFFIDFIPAVRTNHHQSRETSVEMGLNNANNVQNGYYRDGATNARTNAYANGANGYVNGYPNGITNGYANGTTHAHPNGTGINGSTYYPDGRPNPVVKPLEPVSTLR